MKLSLTFIVFLKTQYHEGAQDDEKPGAHPGGHPANLAAVHAQDPRHQEGALLSGPYPRR